MPNGYKVCFDMLTFRPTIMELSFSNHTFKHLGKEVFALSKKIKQMGWKPMMSFLQ